jgi:hypothetical protein
LNRPHRSQRPDLSILATETGSEKETKLHIKMAEPVELVPIASDVADFELNKETFMTTSARATESSKQTIDVVPNSNADPAAVERRSSKQRSRMTNGTALLPDVDGRSAIARRFKDISSAILADQGGAERCSESRRQLVRRFAATAVLAEQMESRLANGEQIDIQEHALLCSTLTRLAQRIGIERRARDVTPPDPLQYAREYDAS